MIVNLTNRKEWVQWHFMYHITCKWWYMYILLIFMKFVEICVCMCSWFYWFSIFNKSEYSIIFSNFRCWLIYMFTIVKIFSLQFRVSNEFSISIRHICNLAPSYTMSNSKRQRTSHNACTLVTKQDGFSAYACLTGALHCEPELWSRKLVILV
jgi:hypothetical protein